MNSSTDRLAKRNSLLSNGYRPLPAHSKGIHISGWSRREITKDWLAQYARVAKYPNTGLRCDNLIAFDIDVTDEQLADSIEALIESELGETEYCRVGLWPKRLLLYRCTEFPEKSGRTGKYGGHIVEMLCGKGRQFIAYGMHPSGVEYTWQGQREPLQDDFSNLPAIGYDNAFATLAACEDALEASGYEKERRAYLRGAHVSAGVDDLYPDTPVEIDGERMTWAEAADLLTTEGVWGNLYREEYGDWGDSGAVKFQLAGNSGRPMAHDFVYDVTHYEGIAWQQVADLLPPPPAKKTDDMFADPDKAYVTENAVMIGLTNSVCFLPEPEVQYTMRAFHDLYAYLREPDPNAPRSNPNKTIPFTKQWALDPSSMRAHKVELRPDRSERFIEGDHITILNSYSSPVHPESGGETDTFHAFIDYLCPRPGEAELVLDWIAHKITHPGDRMHGLFMVAPKGGAGRGTLAQVLEQLFGPRYVAVVQFSDLTGSTYQGQYNEYLSERLILHIPEVLDTRKGLHDWYARTNAYEAIKEVIEPQSTRMLIRTKGTRNRDLRVFASIFLSTNHANAIALPADDRRVLVIDNDRPEKLSEAGTLKDDIHNWLKSTRNIGALYRELIEWQESSRYDPFADPVMTPAKRRMIESGESDIDRLWFAFVDSCKGDVVTKHHWAKYVAEQAMRDPELDLPATGPKRRRALVDVLTRGSHTPAIGSRSQLSVKDTMVTPCVIRNFDRYMVEDIESIRDLLREQILLNGDPAEIGKISYLPKR